MTRLEAKNISLSVVIEVIQVVSLKLSKVPGTAWKMVQEKMNDVLEKNKDYQTLTQISNILTGEETSIIGIPENLSINDLVYF